MYRSLNVHYLAPSGFSAAQPQGEVLGVAGFGLGRPTSLPDGCPFVEIDLPVLSGEPVYEIWTTDQPVAYQVLDGVALASSKDLSFGSMTIEESGSISLERPAYEAYVKLFDALDSLGYPHLLRVWNYFPDITQEVGGLERYRSFNLGRHDAFMARRRTVASAPAACALGSRSGPMAIYFLAARDAGTPLENPRQVSAYRYPERFGPRSPTFSRAMLAAPGGTPLMFISGTASIVGDESRHLADPLRQTEETLRNISLLRAGARQAGFAGDQRVHLKVYLRDPAYLSVARPLVEPLLRDRDTAVYLQANVCRAELLVEIEGVCLRA